MYLLLEIVSVLFSLVYVILMMRENVLCWLFGILSSALSAVLFIHAKLYSESVLYTFYIIIGLYGWYNWHKPKNEGLKVTTIPFFKHIWIVIAGAVMSFGLGSFFSNYTDTEQPYFDAATTGFSFLASFLEAHKILSSWIYWITINAFTVWLYFNRDLHIYSGLMVVYTVLSILGLRSWHASYKTHANTATVS